MADDEHDGDEGRHGRDGGGQGGGGGVDRGELRQAIRDVLAEMGVGGAGHDGGDPGPGDDGDDDGQDRPGGAYAAEEARWEQLVRRELERVKTADDLTSLKEEVRKIVEKPPVQYRRITRALWGPADD